MSHNPISCAYLLSLNPSKTGYCLKKNSSWWSFLFPWVFSQWNSRFVVLVGDYLFRFTSEKGEKPKGIPIPLDDISIKHIDEKTFVATTLRKNYLFQADCAEETRAWISAIQHQKSLIIKQHMGHAPVDPEIRKLNKACDKLYSTKISIDEQLESKEIVNPMMINGL